jgi:hypothetical protein
MEYSPHFDTYMNYIPDMDWTDPHMAVEQALMAQCGGRRFASCVVAPMNHP